MEIPKTIKIGGLIYKVEIVDEIDDDDAVAKTYFQDLLIRVERAEEEFMKQAFLHEIFHAINGELKETDVEFFAMLMHQIITDNPQMFVKGVK